MQIPATFGSLGSSSAGTGSYSTVVLSPTILGHNFTFEAQSGDDMFQHGEWSRNWVWTRPFEWHSASAKEPTSCTRPSPPGRRASTASSTTSRTPSTSPSPSTRSRGRTRTATSTEWTMASTRLTWNGPGQIKTCFVVRQLQNDASRAAAKSASVVAALALALLALALIGIAFLVMKNRKLRERSAAQNRSCPDGAAEAEQGGGGLREDALGPAGTRVEGMHAVIKPSVAKTRPGGPNNPAGVPWEGLPLNLRKLNFGSLRPGLGLGTRVWSRCAYVRREGAASVRKRQALGE
ncbi:uncharacterized protein LOC143029833 [Oratosquilla oratoria]|uniref:uncharacterized protein LOC143029833 n=1 Tax=Oratosquilla oratoria TaxID=337810 RepID=UPI003F75A151